MPIKSRLHRNADFSPPLKERCLHAARNPLSFQNPFFKNRAESRDQTTEPTTLCPLWLNQQNPSLHPWLSTQIPNSISSKHQFTQSPPADPLPSKAPPQHLSHSPTSAAHHPSSSQKIDPAHPQTPHSQTPHSQSAPRGSDLRSPPIGTRTLVRLLRSAAFRRRKTLLLKNILQRPS